MAPRYLNGSLYQIRIKMKPRKISIRQIVPIKCKATSQTIFTAILRNNGMMKY